MAHQYPPGRRCKLAVVKVADVFDNDTMMIMEAGCMNRISKFFLRDVRCFGGEHEFNIRPLTLLIGENSTGKSTILGCLQSLGSLPDYYGRSSESQIDFNLEPYQMGAFTDIVRRSNPRTENFQLGVEYGTTRKSARLFLTLTERESGSEPIVSQVRWVFDEGEITLFINENNQDRKNEIEVVYGSKQNEFHVSTNRNWFGWPFEYLDFIRLTLSNKEDLNDISRELLQFIDRQLSLFYNKKDRHFRRDQFMRRLYYDLNKIDSIAPIRSKPKRTYDPLKETVTPDGSEMPMTLMNLKTSTEKEWDDLKVQLLHFGRASGLFSDIELRKLGRSKSDPFQLRIKVRGPSANLMDVGYGVSQVLPILVRIFTNRGAKFLLQQPEVHLHPKGQAELASLLANINKTHKNSFVIETHSDYMIDRIRIEILNGNVKPDEVSLIYLEPDGNQVKTHNIRFDAQANMINVPDGYRDFFLKESNKLLGFKD